MEHPVPGDLREIPQRVQAQAAQVGLAGLPAVLPARDNLGLQAADLVEPLEVRAL